MGSTSQQFGEAVKAALVNRKLSLRQAQIKTGVDHSTILKMSKGWIPRKHMVIDLAVGLGEDINEWLVLAGYERLPDGSYVTTHGSVKAARVVPDNTGGNASIFPVPEAVRQAIDAAPDNAAKIEEAWEYIQRPEFGLRMGAYKAPEVDTRAKLVMIRMLERLQGGEILPPEVI